LPRLNGEVWLVCLLLYGAGLRHSRIYTDVLNLGGHVMRSPLDRL